MHRLMGLARHLQHYERCITKGFYGLTNDVCGGSQRSAADPLKSERCYTHYYSCQGGQLDAELFVDCSGI